MGTTQAQRNEEKRELLTLFSDPKGPISIYVKGGPQVILHGEATEDGSFYWIRMRSFRWDQDGITGGEAPESGVGRIPWSAIYRIHGYRNKGNREWEEDAPKLSVC